MKLPNKPHGMSQSEYEFHVKEMQRTEQERWAIIKRTHYIPQWISVKEQLPETSEWVVVWYCDKNGEYFPTVGMYRDGGWFTDVDNNDSAFPPVKITHWMKLPKPPVQ
jgi:hypothetical protein